MKIYLIYQIVKMKIKNKLKIKHKNKNYTNKFKENIALLQRTELPNISQTTIRILKHI